MCPRDCHPSLSFFLLLLLLLLPPPLPLLIEGSPVGVVGGPVSLGGSSAPHRVRYSHAGLCPNEVNPNLWVDAQSTCEKECTADHVCENHEKCCQNVCGSRSCVASRFVAPSTSSSSYSADERRPPFGRQRGPGATCARVICAQQGSRCDLWDGQPICRCRDRCEPDPSFTCASDGLTYYNRCYMDAEACNKGVALAVVPCRFQLSWSAASSESSTQVSNQSLGGSEATSINSPTPATTAQPDSGRLGHDEPPRAPAEEVVAPVLLSNPVHQVIRAGGTVSFVCGIGTRSKAEVTWEKQLQHPQSRHGAGGSTAAATSAVAAAAAAGGARGSTRGGGGAAGGAAGGDGAAGGGAAGGAAGGGDAAGGGGAVGGGGAAGGAGGETPEFVGLGPSGADAVIVMRPDHVYGNAVVTNIGQLVIYNARQEDSGSYTCLVSNRAGAVRASFTLSVIPFPPASSSSSSSSGHNSNNHHHSHHHHLHHHSYHQQQHHQNHQQDFCHQPADRYAGCGGNQHVFWFYDARRNGCYTFLRGDCRRSASSSGGGGGGGGGGGHRGFVQGAAGSRPPQGAASPPRAAASAQGDNFGQAWGAAAAAAAATGGGADGGGLNRRPSPFSSLSLSGGGGGVGGADSGDDDALGSSPSSSSSSSSAAAAASTGGPSGGTTTTTIGGHSNAFETHEDCRAACVNETARVCSLPPVQGPCKAWETRWSYNPLGKRCATFLYGGCEGNGNSFASRSACERACPLTSGTSVGSPPASSFSSSLSSSAAAAAASSSSSSVCRPCRTKNKIVPSFCRSDFAIVGRMLEVVDDGTDAGLVRFTVDEVLKDDKMGLKAFNIKLLEITMLQVDWGCPCPNITSAEAGPLLVMGEVQEGIAVLYPDSYVRAVSERRARKLYEVVDRKTCDLLQRFHD